MCVIDERVLEKERERCDNNFLRFIREIFLLFKQLIDVCRVDWNEKSWKLLLKKLN